MDTTGTNIAPQQFNHSGGVSWDFFYTKLGRAFRSSQVVTELSSYLNLEIHDVSSFDILACEKYTKADFQCYPP